MAERPSSQAKNSIILQQLARADLRLLTRSDLWSGGDLVEIQGAFQIELQFEEGGSGRLVTKHAEFWEKLDGEVRMEATERKEFPQAQLVCWRFNLRPSGDQHFVRQVFVRLADASAKQERVLVSAYIVQRKPAQRKRIATASPERTKAPSAHASFSGSSTARPLLLKQLTSFESWSLRLTWSSPMPKHPDWDATWDSTIEVDMWTLPDLIKIHVLNQMQVSLYSFSNFFSAKTLRSFAGPDRLTLAVEMSLSDPRSDILQDNKQFITSLQRRFVTRPFTRLQLPRRFLYTRTTTSAVTFVELGGGLYTGPLVNGQQGGYGKWSFGDPSLGPYVKGEGYFKNTLPNGSWKSSYHFMGQGLLSYEGLALAGWWTSPGKLVWPDGSYYEGPTEHHFIHLASRRTGQKYMVAVMPFTSPMISPLPIDAPVGHYYLSPSAHRLQRSPLPVFSPSLQSLFEAIEQTELEVLNVSPGTEALPLEPLPIETALQRR